VKLRRAGGGRLCVGVDVGVGAGVVTGVDGEQNNDGGWIWVYGGFGQIGCLVD
jgi:hypothetical protein